MQSENAIAVTIKLYSIEITNIIYIYTNKNSFVRA